MPAPPPRPDPDVLATALARVHHGTDATDGPRLIDYAESPRVGGWTLRSALVRVAQPEPVRASAVLELIRRTDGALADHRRRLDAEHVPTVPGLDADDATPEAIGRLPKVWDARVSDLGRVLAFVPDGEAVVSAYLASESPDADAASAVPLLAAVAELDALADRLAAWADARTGPPPNDDLDRIAGSVFQRLAQLGVPREDERRPRRNT